jgi:hypothetical protein
VKNRRPGTIDLLEPVASLKELDGSAVLSPSKPSSRSFHHPSRLLNKSLFSPGQPRCAKTHLHQASFLHRSDPQCTKGHSRRSKSVEGLFRSPRTIQGANGSHEVRFVPPRPFACCGSPSPPDPLARCRVDHSRNAFVGSSFPVKKTTPEAAPQIPLAYFSSFRTLANDLLSIRSDERFRPRRTVRNSYK